jgi:glycosyltransferase involved in cell wall biosynthesis
MKVVQLSAGDEGGAGRAAIRLHRALLDSGADSTMIVNAKASSDWRVQAKSGLIADVVQRARILVEQVPGAVARVPDAHLFSPAITGSLRAREVNALPVDVVNAHWTNIGYLSVAQFGRITKPLVWTLHDMWAFTGGRHYEGDAADARWHRPYTRSNRVTDGSRFDAERWVWQRKSRHWRTPRHIVTPSTWLAERAASSSLLADWPVHVIPNALDTSIFKPRSKAAARDFFDLPHEPPLILFSLTTGLDDPRKGWDLLKAALATLHRTNPEVELAVLGHEAPPEPWDPGLPRAHWLGRLHDDRALAMAYSAADVSVVPSRQDNLPQTGTEAQACGCPVVAFSIGGLPDIVRHRETGYLAEAFDPQDLAGGLAWVLDDPHRREALGTAARERAVRLWSQAIVSAQYTELYEQVLAEHAV